MDHPDDHPPPLWTDMDNLETPLSPYWSTWFMNGPLCTLLLFYIRIYCANTILKYLAVFRANKCLTKLELAGSTYLLVQYVSKCFVYAY